MNCQRCGFQNKADAKFCKNCGSRFKEEITCPQCQKVFPAGTKFCDVDGTKLNSLLNSLREQILNPPRDKIICYMIVEDVDDRDNPPRVTEQMPKTHNAMVCEKCDFQNKADAIFCEKCGTRLEKEATCPQCKKVFPTDTKFCDVDGTKLTNDDIRIDPKPDTSEVKGNLSKIALGLSIAVAVIDVYIVLHYFSVPKLARAFVGEFNAFLLYLNHEVLGWSITAVVLSALSVLIYEVVMDKEDKYSEKAGRIIHYAGGLAVIFLIVGLFANVIIKMIN
jgi:RNA polymerase subunit RPABC4/transcription elongation factor Spt4